MVTVFTPTGGKSVQKKKPTLEGATPIQQTTQTNTKPVVDAPNVRKVTFNKDKTVTVQQGEVTKTLSKEDYKNYDSLTQYPNAASGAKGDVQELLQAQQDMRLEDTVRKKLTEQRKIAAIEAEFRNTADIEKQNELKSILAKVGVNLPELGALEVGGESNIATGIKGASVLSAIGGGAAAGAAIGGAAGTAVPIVGNAAGAVGGAVVGGIGTGVPAALGALSLTPRKTVSVAYNDFQEGTTAIKTITTALNRGQIDPEQAIEAYNLQLAKINRAERALKEQTKTDTKAFLSGGREEYNDIMAWKEIQFVYDSRIKTALVNPNPNYIDTVNNIQQ